MYCKNCGKENKDNLDFCAYCGTQLSDNTSNAFVQQQPTENKTAVMLTKLNKEKRIKLIVMLVLLVLFFVMFFVSVEKSSNAKLLPAEKFNTSTSSVNDYVTVDIVGVEPFYEYYTEKNGNKTINYYSCLAIDTNFNSFVIKVPYSYYNEKLSHLELTDSFSYNDYETIYGTVNKIDSGVKNCLINEMDLDGESANALIDKNCVTVLRNPKKESNGLMPFVILMFILFFAGMIIFIKSASKFKALSKAQKDYGDVIDIIDHTKENSLYSDDSICVSKDYIVSNNKKITIVSTQEALCLYQYIHKTNFVVDNVALVVVNKYGEKINFNYKPTQKDYVPKVIAKIYPLFPNAALGFDNKSTSYINQKKISR